MTLQRPQIDGAVSTEGSRSPLAFFVLVYVLAVPFWLAGAAVSLELLPRLPLAALGVVCPITAALMLVYRRDGTQGMVALLRRSVRFRQIKPIWWVPVLLLIPAATAIAFAAIRAEGVAIPAPHIDVLSALTLFIVFLAGAICEELGWSGYATDPVQDRWGALAAGILVGLVWAVWHVVPLIQAQRSWAWIGWWTLGTVSMRVIMVWLYNNTGKSVFAVAVFHAISNLAWQLFPVHGSYFDPRTHGLIMAAIAVIVTAIWGPQMLGRAAKPLCRAPE